MGVAGPVAICFLKHPVPQFHFPLQVSFLHIREGINKLILEMFSFLPQLTGWGIELGLFWKLHLQMRVVPGTPSSYVRISLNPVWAFLLLGNQQLKLWGTGEDKQGIFLLQTPILPNNDLSGCSCVPDGQQRSWCLEYHIFLRIVQVCSGAVRFFNVSKRLVQCKATECTTGEMSLVSLNPRWDFILCPWACCPICCSSLG